MGPPPIRLAPNPILKDLRMTFDEDGVKFMAYMDGWHFLFSERHQDTTQARSTLEKKHTDRDRHDHS